MKIVTWNDNDVEWTVEKNEVPGANLLTRDYNTDHKFSISTNTLSGVALTSTVLRKGVVHAADVSTQYKYRNALFDVKIDTDSNVMTTITITEILPSTKAIASFKVPDYNSSKLEVQYFHDHATVTATAALKQNPLVDLTATLGSPTISFGAEAGYDTTSRLLLLVDCMRLIT
ncbi:unnamed protein product [Brassica oleracea var. botrytis]